MAEKDWIRKYFRPLATAPGAAGLLDDTAELRRGTGALVVTTDAMAEGVHFFPDDPLETVAAKLVRVNVSDILSAGAAPREALLTLGWPRAGRQEEALAGFAASLGSELQAWSVSLAGGDTVCVGSGLFLSMTMTGECLGPGPIRRSGGQPGDDLWVSGTIGGARRGYLYRTTGEGDASWLRSMRLPDLPAASIARLIADHAHCALDISDGLLGDLAALAEASGLGAHVRLEDIPLAGGARGPAEVIDLASWGDDYQLLFSAAPAAAAAIARFGLPVTRIGHLLPEKGLFATFKGKAVNLPERLAFEHGRIGMSATRP